MKSYELDDHGDIHDNDDSLDNLGRTSVANFFCGAIRSSSCAGPTANRTTPCRTYGRVTSCELTVESATVIKRGVLLLTCLELFTWKEPLF